MDSAPERPKPDSVPTLEQARKWARNRKWNYAVRALTRISNQRPNARELRRTLVIWSDSCDNPVLQRDALEQVVRQDRGIAGFEALRRLVQIDRSSENPDHLMRAEMSALALHDLVDHLDSDAAPLADRVDYATQELTAQAVVNLLADAGIDQTRALPMNSLLRAFTALRRGQIATQFLDLTGGDYSALRRNGEAMGQLAEALVLEGRTAEAMAILRATEDNGQNASALYACRYALAQQDGDTCEAAEIAAKWLHDFPGDPRAADAVTAQAVLEDGEGLLANLPPLASLSSRNAAVLIQALSNAQHRDQALAMAREAMRIWPTEENVGAAFIAASRSLPHLIRGAQLRQQIVEELPTDLVSLLGAGGLQKAGGRAALHQTLLDAVGDGGGVEGLLMLARLAQASLEVLLSERAGRDREARELAPYGAASWARRVADVEKLSGFIRSCCALILKQDPDDLRADRTLLALQAALAEDTPLTRQVCASFQSRIGKDPDPQVERDLWRAAMSCDQPKLWNDLARRAGATDLRIMPWGELSTDIPGVHQLYPARALHKNIIVHAPGFSGPMTVGTPTQDEYWTDPMTVDVWGGQITSIDDTHALRLSWNEFIPPWRNGLRYAGTKAAGFNVPTTPVEVLTDPIVFVPGIRACYNNYYHFAGQALPRILSALKRAREESGGRWRLALPGYALSFTRDMLAVCGIGEDDIVTLPMDGHARLTHCRIVNATRHDWQCAPEDLALARQILQGSRKGGKPSRKLFLARPFQSVSTKGRALTNEPELIEVALRHGFEIVDPAGLTQPEQRDLFGEAAVICGPAGAAMTNTLYVPNGGRIISIAPLDSGKTFFPGLTVGQPLDYTWVLGPIAPELRQSRRFPQLPFSASAALLDQALSE